MTAPAPDNDGDPSEAPSVREASRLVVAELEAGVRLGFVADGPVACHGHDGQFRGRLPPEVLGPDVDLGDPARPHAGRDGEGGGAVNGRP